MTYFPKSRPKYEDLKTPELKEMLKNLPEAEREKFLDAAWKIFSEGAKALDARKKAIADAVASFADMNTEPTEDLDPDFASNSAMLKCVLKMNDSFVADGDQDSIMPQVFLVGRNGKLTIMGVPELGDPEAKEGLLEMISAALGVSQAQRYAIVMEAWVSAQAAGEERKYAMPSLDPDRREVVFTVVVARDGSHQGSGKTIVRNEAGNIIALKDDLVFEDSIGFGGRMTDLFGTPKVVN